MGRRRLRVFFITGVAFICWLRRRDGSACAHSSSANCKEPVCLAATLPLSGISGTSMYLRNKWDVHGVELAVHRSRPGSCRARDGGDRPRADLPCLADSLLYTESHEAYRPTSQRPEGTPPQHFARWLEQRSPRLDARGLDGGHLCGARRRRFCPSVSSARWNFLDHGSFCPFHGFHGPHSRADGSRHPVHPPTTLNLYALPVSSNPFVRRNLVMRGSAATHEIIMISFNHVQGSW